MKINQGNGFLGYNIRPSIGYPTNIILFFIGSKIPSQIHSPSSWVCNPLMNGGKMENGTRLIF
jgi:hypothetical protein